jgi:multiple sugar transport system ATP-binding protein
LLRDIKTTTIYVTHDQTEAMSLADRIAVMHGGAIVQYDVPPTVYQQPATTFVGGFIGSPPMNFLEAVDTHAALGLVAPPKAKTLGIRPEDLELSTDGGLPVHAKVVEMLGASQQVNSRVGGELLRVSTNASPTIEPNQHIHVRAKEGAARWYDEAGHLMAV